MTRFSNNYARMPTSYSRRFVLSLYRACKLSLSYPVVIDLQPAYLPDLPTGVDLENVLKSIAEQKFEKQFGYPYRGEQTIPRNVAADAERSIISIHDICSITDDSDDSDQIEEYVDSRLLKSVYFAVLAPVSLPTMHLGPFN